nr:retrovirus-related Pol polyprotein from transposon TNT 1-94 [Tanacetum cinerariifolium]
DEYETWAMKMEYWIMNTDHNLWKIIQNGNSKKSLGRDSKGGIIILPLVSFEEHIAIQREAKARTLLIQSLPEDHMADFHHLDDAREIWLAMKARFSGLHKGYDRFQKILSQLNQMQAKPDNDDVNIKFLKALLPSWSLEIDVKGGSSYGSRSTTVAPTYFAFIRAASTNTKMVYSDQPSHSSSISYTLVPSGGIMKDVDEKARYSAFKISEVKTEEPKAMVSVDSMLNYNDHDADNKTEEAEQVYGLMAGFESDFADPTGNAAGGVNPAAVEFAMMGNSPKEVKFVESLARFVKAGKMNEVPSPITGTFMPTSYQSDLVETQATFGLKSNTSSIPTSESNDFVSYDNSDKFSASKTYDFASCVSSLKTNDSFSTVDVKLLPKSDVKDPSLTNDLPSCSFKENVKPPRNLYNFPSVFLKAASIPASGRNSLAYIFAGRSIPATSRNGSATIYAGRSIPAASRNRSTSIHAGRSISATSRNKSAYIHVGRSIHAASRNGSTSIHAGRSFLLLVDINQHLFIPVHSYMNKDIGIVDSGCSRIITGNKEKLNDFVQVKGGTVTFRGRDEAVNTACYVLNRVSITNPHNKTPYELLSGKVPNIQHLKPFGCQVTILNTSDHLGKFEWKANDGFLVGYTAHSKAYRVYNLSSKKVEETLNLRYLEDKPNVQGLGQEWYFDLHYLTDSLGYTRFRTNPPIGTHDTNILAGTQADDSESECDEQVILVPSFPSNSFSGLTVHDVSAPMENNLDYAAELARLQSQEHEAHSAAAKHGFEFSVDTAALLPQAEYEIRRNLVPAVRDPAGSVVPTGGVPASSVPVSGVLADSVPASGVLTGSIVSTEFGDPAARTSVPAVFTNDPAAISPLPLGHSLGSCKHTTIFPSPSDHGNHQTTAGIFSSSSYDDDFCADVTNIALNVVVDPVATKRCISLNLVKVHLSAMFIIRLGLIMLIIYIVFACFLSQLKPSSVAKALEDSEWVAAMQEEMKQFYNQQVWKLVPLPDGKIAISTKWILKNKRDARGIVVRNKARLVAKGHR